jgi:hypothetical protein
MRNSSISKNNFRKKLRYELKLDTTEHVKMSETPVFKAIEKEALVTYVPGGCSYNTMRVFHVRNYL